MGYEDFLREEFFAAPGPRDAGGATKAGLALDMRKGGVAHGAKLTAASDYPQAIVAVPIPSDNGQP